MVNQFNDTTAPIIAIELFKDDGHWSRKTIIDENCFAQLIRVINYAHDQGGKRVIIINRTDYFSDDELMTQIITQLPDREKKRTTDRLRLLLGLN